MNRDDKQLFDKLLSMPIRTEVRAALAASHSWLDVLRALPRALGAVRFDATIPLGDHGQLDCAEPNDTGWPDGLNDHDRAVVAAFIAALEGRIAHNLERRSP